MKSDNHGVGYEKMLFCFNSVMSRRVGSTDGRLSLYFCKSNELHRKQWTILSICHLMYSRNLQPSESLGIPTIRTPCLILCMSSASNNGTSFKIRDKQIRSAISQRMDTLVEPNFVVADEPHHDPNSTSPLRLCLLHSVQHRHPVSKTKAQ